MSLSAVFQAGGLVVTIVEVGRKAYLASLVPVIVNAILNEHQIIVDIVAFVQKGDFPRSRLGEKQRGKILAGWVSRKMRTIAQFAIRDTATGGLDEARDHPDNGSGHRASIGSFRHSQQIGLANVGSTLRNVEPAPQILEQRELEQQLEHMGQLPPEGMRAGYHHHNGSNSDSRDGQTPTGPRADQQQFGGGPSGPTYELPDFDHFGDDDDGTPPGVGPKPTGGAPEIRLAEVDWRGHAVESSGGGGLHVRNTSIQNEEDWTADAIAGMRLGEGRGDAIGRGY